MTFSLTKKSFKIIILIMVVIIILFAGIIVVVSLDIPGKIIQSSGDSSRNPGSDQTDEKTPWGYKSREWEYNGETLYCDYEIYENEYKTQHASAFGTKRPDGLESYISDDAVIQEISDRLTDIAQEHSCTDRETVDLILSFAHSIPYLTDEESGHAKSFPRTPLVTLADECGDSEDLSLLAVSLLRGAGYAAVVAWYPATVDRNTLIPEAAAVGIISNDTSDGPVYETVSNNTVIPVKILWAADTNEKGFPVAAYNGITPQIVSPDALLSGKEVSTAPKQKKIRLIETAEKLPAGPLQDYPKEEYWRDECIRYYEEEWLTSPLEWRNGGHGNLKDIYVNVKGDSVPLYTAEQTAEYTSAVPWRLSYAINKIDAVSEKGMSPFAVLDIAVFRITDKNPELIEMFGWQGHDDANTTGTSKIYTPGKYAVSIFSRNVDAEISLQYPGKDAPEYHGGI
ncbi:MAG: hypothetical protein Q4Q20_04275 [Methanocorpusculum sp.]|nr:hypothetical protein [Methanocorpusculum sp.]